MAFWQFFGRFRNRSISTSPSWVLGLQTCVIFNAQNPLQMAHVRAIFYYFKNGICLPSRYYVLDFSRIVIFNRSASREIWYRIYLFLNHETPSK